MKLHAILETAHATPERALVRLAAALLESIPDLRSADGDARSNPSAHEQARAGVLTALEEGRMPWPTAATVTPLAAIEALDAHVYGLDPSDDEGAPSRFEADSGRAYFLHRRTGALPPTAVHARQAGKLQPWMRRHWLVPATHAGLAVSVRQPPGHVRDRLRAVANGAEVRVYLGSFDDGVGLSPPPEPRAMTFSGLTDVDLRWASVEAHLGAARGARADVLVLPELTVTPELRDRVAGWLYAADGEWPALTLAGSFHETDGGRVVNRAVLLDHQGNCLLAHDKLAPYAEPDARGGFYEAIVPGREVRLLETPLGLLAVATCLDYCEEAPPLGELWACAGVEWVLVPAMDGSSCAAYLAKAASLHRAHGTCSLACNQPPGGAGGPRPVGEAASADPPTAPWRSMVCHGDRQKGEKGSAKACLVTVRHPP